MFAVSLPAVTTRLYSSDEVQYYSYLRSLYFDHDVSFENEYQYFYDHDVARSAGFHETFLERETRVHRRVNYATVGAAILWSPFYAAADVLVRGGGRHPADGFSQPYISAVAYGSAFYAFLAVLLSIRAARIVLGPRCGFIAGAAVWIGTPLLFYMYVAPPFSHACSAFAVALFVNIWLHVRRQWSARGALALGASAALMTMVREQDAFVAIGPAVDFLLHAAATVRNNARASVAAVTSAVVAGVIGFIVCYSPQLLAYKALNGYPGPAEHVSRKMSWYAPHGVQVLASPSHGFFFWTPLAIAAIVGIVAMLVQREDVERRTIGLALLLMVASQVYVAGSVESWTVAGAFGQRRFICLTVVLVIGLAALLQLWSTQRARLIGGLLIVTMVWWNVALIAQFATRMMDRQRLEPARNAYNAFVTLPLTLPSLMYRYVFDRASFYDTRQPETR